jgi:hypothetical protein
VKSAQTTGTLTYGSLAPAETSSLITNYQQYVPLYVAQNVSALSTTAAANAANMFDPYSIPSPSSWFTPATSGNTSTGGLGQNTSANVYSGNFDRLFPETYQAMRRFREVTSLEYTHLPRSGSRSTAFGMDEIDIRMQLAFPCRFVPNNGKTGLFYAAPATSFVWWNGPSDPEVSPNGFGAFIDFGVQPKFNDTFSLIAWGRVGIFSDFEKVTSDAWRYQGRLEGVGTLSQQMQLHAGVIYYGRARIKLLPTVGVTWSPDENWVLRLVFPNPKVSRRLWSGPQADWWGYILMDYAGGSWDVTPMGGLTDYNDIRLGMGIEFAAPNRLGGYFEFGGSFGRELYSSGRRQADLPSVIYL